MQSLIAVYMALWAHTTTVVVCIQACRLSMWIQHELLSACCMTTCMLAYKPFSMGSASDEQQINNISVQAQLACIETAVLSTAVV